MPPLYRLSQVDDYNNKFTCDYTTAYPAHCRISLTLNFLESVLVVNVLAFTSITQLSIADYVAHAFDRYVLRLPNDAFPLFDRSDEHIYRTSVLFQCFMMSVLFVRLFFGHFHSKSNTSSVVQALSAISKSVMDLKLSTESKLGRIDARVERVERTSDSMVQLLKNTDGWADQLLKNVSETIDLTYARRKASKMSRRDLHKITTNALKRRVRILKRGLDTEQVMRIQTGIKNQEHVQSVAEFERQIVSIAEEHRRDSNALKIVKTESDRFQGHFDKQDAVIDELRSENAQFFRDLRQQKE